MGEFEQVQIGALGGADLGANQVFLEAKGFLQVEVGVNFVGSKIGVNFLRGQKVGLRRGRKIGVDFCMDAGVKRFYKV